MPKLRLLCTEFDGVKNRKGYGQVWFESKLVGAHRKAYVLHHGLCLKDIEGKVVRHMCDNPSCVNPDHLLLGTVQDNNKDRQERGRSAKRGAHGEAKLSEEDVLFIRTFYQRGKGKMNTVFLSGKFSVTPSTINRIINGKTWK